MRIAGLNNELKAMSNDDLGIYYIDASPKEGRYFDEGLIHFNTSGLEYFTLRLARELSNFHLTQTDYQP